MIRAITEQNLGAWLIKCDPETRFDLPAAIANGVDTIYSWSVNRGYRADMMAENDRVILWVSGNGRRMIRGIWGIGRVAGPVEDAIPDDHDADEVSYWIDQEARRAVELFVPVEIPLFDTALSADDLRASGITDLEVQVMPQGSNPSWVSVAQLTQLMDLLPEWPEEVEWDGEITISARGAGFGSPVKNAVIEAAAMAAVIDYYDGWKPKDVSHDKVGWDITFNHPQTGTRARVEVKGVAGHRRVVLLTRNEIQAANTKADWRLAVVTRALSSPTVTEYTAEEALALAEPYVYRATLPTTTNTPLRKTARARRG